MTSCPTVESTLDALALQTLKTLRTTDDPKPFRDWLRRREIEMEEAAAITPVVPSRPDDGIAFFCRLMILAWMELSAQRLMEARKRHRNFHGHLDSGEEMSCRALYLHQAIVLGFFKVEWAR